MNNKNTALLTRCITYLRRSSRYSGALTLQHGGLNRNIMKLRVY